MSRVYHGTKVKCERCGKKGAPNFCADCEIGPVCTKCWLRHINSNEHLDNPEAVDYSDCDDD